jgi:probable rRNA maturation factor
MKSKRKAKTQANKASLLSNPTINILQSQKRYPIDEKQISRLVKAFFLFHKLPHDEVTIQFVTKAQIGKIHGIHFNDPSITDCMSFPMDSADDPGYRVLGEVVVCPGVAYEYATDHNCPYDQEVDLYVTHGLLHLIGFDDIKEKDRKIMRMEEQRFLTAFWRK